MLPRARAAFAARPLAWGIALVVAAALTSSVNGLGNGFAYDDIPILVENPMVGSLHSPAEYLADSYWGPSRGNSLYRPVTIAAFSLEWAIGGGSPLPFHIANVLLYVVAAVVVLLLLRLLLPPGPALAGGVAWAVHPVHVEAVANVVGQSEMLAAIPMLVAVLLFIRGRRAGRLTPGTVATILGCYVLALLSKEHGIVLPALLVAAEILVRSEPEGMPEQVRAPAPWFLVRGILLVTFVYLVARLSILEGFAGDTPHPAITDIGGGARRWVMLALVPEFARLLWWPARLYADYSPNAIPFAPVPGLVHLLGVAWLAFYALALGWAWRRDRVVTFALLWLPVTLGPVSNVLVPTGVLIAERTLFLPSVAVAILVGVLVVRLAPRLAAVPTRWVRVAAVSAAIVVLVAGAARSVSRQLVWEDNATLFSTTVVEAPNNFRAHHALGELFGGAGAWRRAEEHLRIADSLFPGYDLIELSLARVLHFDDRCPDALVLYDAVLAKRKDAEIASIGRAACLLESRRLSEARAAAVEGIARGRSVGPFGMLLQKAESSLVANDTVDNRNRWFLAGAPVSKSNARLKVPVLFQRPAGVRKGRRMPESPPKPP